MPPSVPSPHESKIYSDLSHLYDRIFTRVFSPRIEATIRELSIGSGSRVLEVGVGTGLSLSAYPLDASVLGIDLAPDMLEQAHEKVEREGWTHVDLRVMDALNLELEDASFDYVMAFHVVSVVPNVERLMEEISRVLKPGGTVVVINHFRSERPWLAWFVDRIDPITRMLGWRTTLSFRDLLEGTGLEVERRFKLSELDIFTVLVATKPASDAGAASPEAPSEVGYDAAPARENATG